MPSFLRFLLRLFFPQPCVSCGYLGEALCERCRDRLHFFPHVRELDGLPVASALYFQDGDLLEQLIHPFKYAHQADLMRFLVPPLREALKLLLEPSRVVLVPVPLYRKRERERGYNQAEVLAQGIARALGIPVVPLLKRVRDTGSQARLKHRDERQKNLHAAFELCQPLPRDGQIVLVDDIVTSGSTLLECANVLRSAGARELFALTLADRNEAPTPPWH